MRRGDGDAASGLGLRQHAAAGAGTGSGARQEQRTDRHPRALERLARDGGLEGALVTIDAMGCNAAIAQAVRSGGADYLIAVKANQKTLMAELDLFFGDAEKTALD